MADASDGAVLDPTSSEGRRLLSDELAKPEYSSDESLLSRVVNAVRDWIADLFEGTGGVLTVWEYVLTGLAVIVMVAVGALVLWTLLRLEPVRRAHGSPSAGVFDETGVSAAEYRRRATAARAAGDLNLAVLEAYRAIVAESVERFILDDLPGATAREMATALRAVFPGEALALDRAAGCFDSVRYGEQPASAGDADTTLDLDRRLLAAAPAHGAPA